MTILDTIKLGNRLQIIKTNLDYATELLEGEDLKLANELSASVDFLLDQELSEEVLEEVQLFMEDNEAKVSNLNEEAILESIEDPVEDSTDQNV